MKVPFPPQTLIRASAQGCLVVRTNLCDLQPSVIHSDCDGWLEAGASAPSSDSQSSTAVSASEEDPACCEQRSITETVTNGSMKETVSLTVDAKTETAVFKRFAKHTSSSSSGAFNRGCRWRLR